MTSSKTASQGRKLDFGKVSKFALNAYRGCVVTLPPPVLLPVQEIF